MAEKNASSLVRRHFRLRTPGGGEVRRSVALEAGFWQALDEIAPGPHLRLLIEACLGELSKNQTLVSALRCFVLNYYRGVAINSVQRR